MTGAEEWTKGLHRALRVRVGPDETRAILHDDFHHFRLRLRHDGTTVLAATSEMLRGPYSLCPRAGEELKQLAGRPLAGGAAGLSLRQQCTHQFELAALAMAASGRGQDCHYAMGVRTEDAERFSGWIARDGQRLLDCRIEDQTFTAPQAFAGQPLGAGFTGWAAARLAPELAEAALLLRRAVILARARRHLPRLDALGHAPANGNCWVQQPATAVQAKRHYGVVRDYSQGRVPFDRDDQDWLVGAVNGS